MPSSELPPAARCGLRGSAGHRDLPGHCALYRTRHTRGRERIQCLGVRMRDGHRALESIWSVARVPRTLSISSCAHHLTASRPRHLSGSQHQSLFLLISTTCEAAADHHRIPHTHLLNVPRSLPPVHRSNLTRHSRRVVCPCGGAPLTPLLRLPCPAVSSCFHHTLALCRHRVGAAAGDMHRTSPLPPAPPVPPEPAPPRPPYDL